MPNTNTDKCKNDQCKYPQNWLHFIHTIGRVQWKSVAGRLKTIQPKIYKQSDTLSRVPAKHPLFKIQMLIIYQMPASILNCPKVVYT